MAVDLQFLARAADHATRPRVPAAWKPAQQDRVAFGAAPSVFR
jgi:hypothetical protein